MLEILKNKVFVRTKLADLISNFGDILYYIALLNYVLKIENSNLGVAIITLSEIIPVFFAFLLGYIADKSKSRIKTIIITLVFRMILYLIVAIVVGFEPSLLIVVFLSFVNLVSDLAGQYENWLYYPITKNLIPNDTREKVMAFTQSLSGVLNIVFQAIGGILICYISFSNLALINSGTFLVSLLIVLSIKLELRKYYVEKDCDTIIPQERKTIKKRLITLKTELKEAIELLWKIPGIKETLISLPFLNGALIIIKPLVILNISENPNFCIINSEITLAVLLMCETVGILFGSALTCFIFEKFKLTSELKLAIVFSMLILIGIFIQNIYIVFIGVFVSSLFCGSMDPKMGAQIFNSLDENKLAISFGGMTTYFQLGDIVSRILFSILVVTISPKAIVIFYFLVLICSMILVFRKSN